MNNIAITSTMQKLQPSTTYSHTASDILENRNHNFTWSERVVPVGQVCHLRTVFLAFSKSKGRAVNLLRHTWLVSC
eukprot:2615522-Pleurochrysis_carterae.AAC.1